MRPGGSKAKGASFEREVCKALSLWVSHGKREDLYWRSAMSGGRATVASRVGKNLASQAGDISSIDKTGWPLTADLYFEAKHVKDLSLDNFIIKGTGPLAGYWKTAIREAEKYEKSPVIIARQNRFPTLLIAHDHVVELLHGTKDKGGRGKLAVIQRKDGAVAIWNFTKVLAMPFRYEESVL